MAAKVLRDRTIERLKRRPKGKTKIRRLSDEKYGVLTVIPHALTGRMCCPEHGPISATQLDAVLSLGHRNDVPGPFVWHPRHLGYPVVLRRVDMLCHIEFLCPAGHVLRNYYEPGHFGHLTPGKVAVYYQPGIEERYPVLEWLIEQLRSVAAKNGRKKWMHTLGRIASVIRDDGHKWQGIEGQDRKGYSDTQDRKGYRAR